MTNKPMLICVGGMSGSGKTTLAAALAAKIPNAVHVDSDKTRKELFGVSEATRLPAESYTTEATQRVVEKMDEKVKAALAQGKNVIASATFLSPIARKHEEELAAESGARYVALWLKTDLNMLFDRVSKRVNDASDADVEIVKRQGKTSSPPADWPKIDASQSKEAVLEEALKIIQLVAAPASAPKPPKPAV